MEKKREPRPIPSPEDVERTILDLNIRYRSKGLTPESAAELKKIIAKCQSDIDNWNIQPGDLVRMKGELRILAEKEQHLGSMGAYLYWCFKFGNGENCWHGATVNRYPDEPHVNMEWPIVKPQTAKEFREYKKSLVRWYDKKEITRDQFRIKEKE